MISLNYKKNIAVTYLLALGRILPIVIISFADRSWLS